MSTTTSSSSSDDEADQHSVDDAPTVMLGAASDRCSRCGAPLAVDQRYCVECGTRRGRPRFLLTPAPGGDQGSGGYANPPSTLRSRIGTLTSSSTLLLGILVLLLAIGVGVLIGHNNSNAASKQARNVVNVTVPSGGGGGSSAASSGTSGASGASGSSSSSSGSSTTASKSSKTSKTKTTAAKSTKTTATKSTAPVSSGGVSKTQNKASTIGGKCTAGTAGCQNGVETGNFF